MSHMALEEIALQLDERELPPRVATLVEDADKRLDHLFDTNRNRRVPRFLPSDPILLFRVLSTGAAVPSAAAASSSASVDLP